MVLYGNEVETRSFVSFKISNKPNSCNMISFIKKYWINILLFFLLAILTFFFLPNQESHYLKTDADVVKSKSRTVLLLTEVILFGTILFLLIKNIKKASELL